MKKGVIFDFDGLLVDTEIISYQIYRIYHRMIISVLRPMLRNTAGNQR